MAQIEDVVAGSIDGREFFRRNYFTSGLELLVRRRFDRLAEQAEDGAFYLTQVMGGGKTHSLIAFGLLAADPALQREIVPSIPSGTGFGAARVVDFNGHQNPDTLLWGHIAAQLSCPDTMAPFWRNGARTPKSTNLGDIVTTRALGDLKFNIGISTPKNLEEIVRSSASNGRRNTDAETAFGTRPVAGRRPNQGVYVAEDFARPSKKTLRGLR